MSHHTRDDRDTVADLLTARGFDRFVVKAADGIFVADNASTALDLLTADTTGAVLYAADGNGPTTLVVSWSGELLRYDGRS